MSDLAKKLKIKPGQQVALINAPASLEGDLGEIPDGVLFSDKARSSTDLALFFAQTSEVLSDFGKMLAQIPRKNGMLWIAFPKKSSGIETDLSRDKGWEPVWGAGMRGVALISIDETWSAMRIVPTTAETPQDMIASQYGGRKTALLPIYERLVSIAESFGDDVEIAPRKSYVALVRKKQFAVIKASTITRVDLGLKLKGIPASDRLEDAGNFGSGSITHKVSLTSIEEVDGKIEDWLRTAYERVA
jgi:hypothetical protein